MGNLRHLVDIHVDRCIGCTRCMRVCPTEAIRIQNNKVNLMAERCIYCGNCISNCHKNAFKVTSDSFANLSKHKLNVVLLPISIYGMVSNWDELNAVYQTLYNYGFDEIFDLSTITQILSEKIEYMLLGNNDKTYILSQCPSIIRLIQLKYPSMLNHLLPFAFPYEVGAKMARKQLSEKYNINESEIGISYVSECISNFIAIKEPIDKKKSNVDYVFLFNDLFKNLNAVKETNLDRQVSKKGILFGKVGAIEKTTGIKEYLSVDGINRVSEVLEKVYLNTFSNIKIIEAYSCVGGCIGGNFTVENTFLSKWKINHFSQGISDAASEKYVEPYRSYLDSSEWYFKEEIKAKDPFKLSDSVNQSLIKMNKINEILKKLPNIDCCACGSPSCRALAEDIVNHLKSIDDCVVLYKGQKVEKHEN